MPLTGKGILEINLSDESGVIAIKGGKVCLFLFIFVLSNASDSSDNDGLQPTIFFPRRSARQTNRALMDCLNGLLDHVNLDPLSSIKLIELQSIL